MPGFRPPTHEELHGLSGRIERDILERLDESYAAVHQPSLLIDAAAEIRRLRAENARLNAVINADLEGKVGAPHGPGQPAYNKLLLALARQWEEYLIDNPLHVECAGRHLDMLKNLLSAF